MTDTFDTDQITTYVMSTSAGIRAFCTACDRQRVVWVGATKGGDTITCCGTCQRIIRRIRTADIPPLSVNTTKKDECACIDCSIAGEPTH